MKIDSRGIITLLKENSGTLAGRNLEMLKLNEVA
jgi:hypothetical protein